MTRRRLTCATGADLERAQADGAITTDDADEVRLFGEFLQRSVGLDEAGKRELYLELYPDPP